jgi:hypothetical protein
MNLIDALDNLCLEPEYVAYGSGVFDRGTPLALCSSPAFAEMVVAGLRLQQDNIRELKKVFA